MYRNMVEHRTGIEPASSAWKADILAVVRPVHIGSRMPAPLRSVEWAHPVNGRERRATTTPCCALLARRGQSLLAIALGR